MGALFFLLMAIPSHAQKTSKEQKKSKSKTEKVQKKESQKLEILKKSSKTKNTNGMKRVSKTANVKTEKLKGPLKKQLVIKMAEPSDLAWFVDREDRRRLKTIGQGFSGGDNSTMTITPKEGEDDEFCTDTVLDTDLNTTDFKDFTTNGPPDWLKPGIIMDAVGFVRGENTIEERYNRGPITITNATLRLVNTVEEPKDKSNITLALANLVSTSREELHPANIQYKYSEVYSKDELNYKINGRYSSDFVDVSAQLGLQSNFEKEQHYYLVEFKQLLFSLEVDGLDKSDIFPDNPEVDLHDYVYLSKVNYGRKGYFMFITDTSLESLNVNSEASSSFMGHNIAVKANFEQIATSENAELRAFYYGGTIESAINDIKADMEAKDFKPLGEYMEGYHFSEAEAYPISYQLKNLYNQRVGMNSKNHQTIGTCVPIRDIKLKVTLLGIECQTTTDRGDTEDGDYGITQHLRYRADGDWKDPIRTQINKFGSRTPCSPGQQNNWANSHSLMCANINNQIHDEMSSVITKQRTANINNYMVFNITPEEANDTNAEFTLNTWVKEYSTDWYGDRDDVVLNYDSRLKKVAIHDVLSILIQKNTDSYDETPYKDGTVGDSQEFIDFDGTSLPLRQLDYPGKVILEGPIRARNPGPDSNEKAFVWMRFELID